VREAGDLDLLLALYGSYRDQVERAVRAVLGGGGAALFLHTYAPRSVDVPVDERIVERLRDAYLPANVGRWPLRAEVDLITRDPEGRRLADDRLIALLQAACDRAGLAHAESGAYALHPSTLAATFASRWPGRTLCVELRRDLLVREFTPFSEMDVDGERADRLAGVLAEALLAWRDG
jgi:hypothetical protein